MNWFYHNIARPVLFAQDAERAHDFTMTVLARAARSNLAGRALEKFFPVPEIPIEVLGLNFRNPLGLAAGMDKFAAAVPVWEKLGFGFCELGGVTWRAQPGNPAPRIFRAVSEGAIVNRMGFNNPGAEVMAEELAAWKSSGRWPNHPVGVNLGKSKVTPLEKAAEDYAGSFRVLREHADFFVINVSSPNTPGLRQLQDKSALAEILAAIQQLQREVPRPKPILVKIAPDLSLEAVDEVLELAGSQNISGIVATNTTPARPPTENPALQKIYSEAGGLSGRPLRARSTEIIRHIFQQTRGQLPIIGVGGIFNATDAWEKIAAGASLIQIYTGLVFEGPGLIKKILSDLVLRMENQGVKDLKQVVGSAALS
ncbi:MAG: quinone-dependent dihydroorotate dehydrogenase [Limisphaerales bacterium]